VKYRKPEAAVAGLVYNEQEQEVMDSLHSTILSYVQESFARFVTGDLNIDRDWDAYIAEFSKMGLPEVIRVTQSAYDRMMK
jgi:putative aldouronate transport system substrate-binding protein